MHLLLHSLQKRPLKEAKGFVFVLWYVFDSEIHIKSPVWPQMIWFSSPSEDLV